LRSELDEHPAVGDVRGRGLFLGLEVVRDRTSKEPAAELSGELRGALRERGVLVGRGGRYGNVIILAPPLVIEQDVLDDGLNSLVEVLG
jgi:4-aminobutyrate aminotransferase-like enzyme